MIVELETFVGMGCLFQDISALCSVPRCEKQTSVWRISSLWIKLLTLFLPEKKLIHGKACILSSIYFRQFCRKL